MSARLVEAFGIRIASAYPFRFHMRVVEGSTDLTFSLVDDPPLAPGWDATVPTFDVTRPDHHSDMLSQVVLVDGCVVARFEDAADFFLWDDRIVCHLRRPSLAHGVDIWFFGTVLALWLELRGVPTLHAASVVAGGRAIAFLATNKGGKSTLALTLMLHGARLLGDDQLPLERSGDAILARPGYPQMRFWPDQAERLLASTDGLERVQPGSTKLRVPIGAAGFGTFAATPAPLAAIYVPERAARGTIDIAPVPLGEALGLAPQRFGTFAAALRQAPLRRIAYPSGVDRLDDVRAAVLDDVAGSAAAAT